MKTEHEKLKAICDEIEFEINMKGKFWKNSSIYFDVGIGEIYINVREIIFTKEFIEKFLLYHQGHGTYNYSWNQVRLGLTENLDNPVDFLCKLIK